MGSQFWDFNRKSMVSKIKVVYSFKSLPSPLMSSRGLESSFFAGKKEAPLQMEISPTNVNLLTKG